MYSAQLLDHFQNPRHAGELPDADAVAEVENSVCGDILRLTLKIQGGRNVEARFKAKGCVASIACASAMTEWISGKTLDQIGQLSRDDISSVLGGLPPASAHAAQLALDALHAALKQIS